MCMGIYNTNMDPELLIGTTVYGKEGEVYWILDYFPDRGFLATELAFDYDEDTDVEIIHRKPYPGYLTKRDLDGFEFYMW